MSIYKAMLDATKKPLANLRQWKKIDELLNKPWWGKATSPGQKKINLPKTLPKRSISTLASDKQLAGILLATPILGTILGAGLFEEEDD